MNTKLESLKEHRQKVLVEIEEINNKIKGTDFDTEDSIEGQDNALFHQLEEDRAVKESHLQEIEAELISLGWTPPPQEL